MKPLLITGVYRSGTTLLSNILRKHPELDIIYDSINYFRYVIKKDIDASKYIEIVKSIEKRMSERYSISLNGEKIINELENTLKTIDHSMIYSFVMNDLFSYSGKRWGEKSVLEWTSIPKFLSMYKESQAIHIIRDPRDVLASRKYMTIAPGKQYLDTIFNCMHSMEHAIKYKDQFPADRYLQVTYEDLILEKEKTTKKICNFLQEKFYDNLIEYENLIDNKGNELSVKTHSSYSDTSPNNLIGRWKEKLDVEDIIITQLLLRNQMNDFNYEIDEKYSNSYGLEFVEKILESDELLKTRWRNYRKTGQGVESFTNDPTDPKNWVVRSGIEGEGAGKGYTKFKD